ncbi:hypothetical protein GW17_00030661 [Ensete ventricosum]|nr:hypothetical protein GW17_00030661 [Ensete ventricosum]RZR96100.1 hypothetical protein BHM03_00025064 [Ensete ventricosum]
MKLCAPDVDEDDDELLLEKPFDLQFAGWCSRLSCAKKVDVVEVADICRKMAAKRSESEASNDDGGRRGQQQRRLWLRCDFVAASGISCSKGAAAIGGRWAAVCTAIAEEGSSGMEREMAAVVFNLLLAAIKIVGSE